MCGIVGYVGDRDCADVLVDALSKLEYRGYDSAGIAVRMGINIRRFSVGCPAGMSDTAMSLRFPVYCHFIN